MACTLQLAACWQIYQRPSVYLDGSTAKWKMDVGITADHGQGESDDDEVDEKTAKPGLIDFLLVLVRFPEVCI